MPTGIWTAAVTRESTSFLRIGRGSDLKSLTLGTVSGHCGRKYTTASCACMLTATWTAAAIRERTSCPMTGPGRGLKLLPLCLLEYPRLLSPVRSNLDQWLRCILKSTDDLYA